MFWERLSALINEHDISASGLAKQIGLSNSAAVKLKKGAIPDSSTLQKIADYFNVSVDYLLGKEKEPSGKTGEFDELTMQFNNLCYQIIIKLWCRMTHYLTPMFYHTERK